MPFVAKRRSTGERIDITKVSDPRRELDRKDLQCQFCEADMVLKAGQILRPHFAHKKKCNSEYRSHPESIDHLSAKAEIAYLLKHKWGDEVDVEFEYALPERKRIADVMVIWKTGWMQAHEIQLAGISMQELEERTNDYRAEGIDVIWWLGKRAATEHNREWCRNSIGEYGSLEFHRNTKSVRLERPEGRESGLQASTRAVELS